MPIGFDSGVWSTISESIFNENEVDLGDTSKVKWETFYSSKKQDVTAKPGLKPRKDL